MSNNQELEAKFVAIGVRYLARTAAELTDLRKLIDKVPVGGKPALREIEVLAHRIRGSGAVFGFHEISTAAEVIEMLAVDQIRLPKVDVEKTVERMIAATGALSDAVQSACKKSPAPLP